MYIGWLIDKCNCPWYVHWLIGEYNCSLCEGGGVWRELMGLRAELKSIGVSGCDSWLEDPASMLWVICSWTTYAWKNLRFVLLQLVFIWLHQNPLTLKPDKQISQNNTCLCHLLLLLLQQQHRCLSCRWHFLVNFRHTVCPCCALIIPPNIASPTTNSYHHQNTMLIKNTPTFYGSVVWNTNFQSHGGSIVKSPRHCLLPCPRDAYASLSKKWPMLLTFIFPCSGDLWRHLYHAFH